MTRTRRMQTAFIDVWLYGGLRCHHTAQRSRSRKKPPRARAHTHMRRGSAVRAQHNREMKKKKKKNAFPFAADNENVRAAMAQHRCGMKAIWLQCR